MPTIEKTERNQYISDHGEKALSVLLDSKKSKVVMVKSHNQATATLVEIDSLIEYQADVHDVLKFPFVVIDEGLAFQMKLLGDKEALKNMYAQCERFNAVEHYCITGMLPEALPIAAT